MRRALTASLLVAFCLSGCATDKSFEKQILGHTAPPSPTDTNWPRGTTPPPPPPPPPAQQQQPAATPAPAQSGVQPATTAPADGRYAPKPFTPAPQPAPAVEKPGSVLFEYPSRQPAQPAAPRTSAPATAHEAGPGAVGESALFNFQVGAFAHSASAQQLTATLAARGFSTHVEQGQINNKVYYRVYAAKAGTRAAIEAELLACGVTEPRLLSQKAVSAAGAPAPAPAQAPTPTRVASPAVPATPARTGQPAQATGTSAPIAPPIVEPAPPLPDGYVPPPPNMGTPKG